MKTIIKLEELAMFMGSILLLIFIYQASWWWYLILFVGPDISMLGYLGGNKAGAFLYNLFHHKGIAIMITVFGFISQTETLIVIGLVLFGHSSMDRFAGFGLKTDKGFKFTHLGEF